MKNAAAVTTACRLIEESEESLSLTDLAQAVGLSSSYFHRTFKAHTGLTPKDYAAAHRAKRVRAALAREATITNAIYDSGFSSSGRFYETSRAMLGMTPSRYREGGTDEDIKFAIAKTTLGDLLVASSATGVAAILLGDDAETLLRQLQDLFPKARLLGAEKDYEAVVAQVVGFIEAPKIGLHLPLDIRGTAFQRRVWQALRDIPFGQTWSYTAIAEYIGMPRATRAVAKACAANKLAIAIPCHRVIRRDGALSGYAWGVDRKEIILDREKSEKDM